MIYYHLLHMCLNSLSYPFFFVVRLFGGTTAILIIFGLDPELVCRVAHIGEYSNIYAEIEEFVLAIPGIRL